MTPFFQFVPLYQERVWGGRALEHRLARTLPGTGPVGESWEIVDRPEAQSVVAPPGPEAGRTLRALLAADPAGIMGPGWPSDRPFPLLVKWLDCRERLSLQVHPPASVAARLGGEPKTENWYVAHAEPGAAVLAGLHEGVAVEDFARAIEQGTAERLVRRHATHAGDSLLIHSGVMHAIDAGNLILEIQQNSDTTYRVFDWGRVGLDGRPRQLHIAASLASLAANPAGPPQLVAPNREAAQVVAACVEFRLTRHTLPPGGTLGFAAGEEPRLVGVTAGRLAHEGRALPAGANLLVPFRGAPTWTAPEGATVLVTDRFARP